MELYIPANSRGTANHGWLQSNFTFSFANYHNPQRMQFGNLRVLNDDSIAPQHGFDMHPHKNMEIITIILSGELQHTDSMGNTTIIKPGDVQVMSAGSGLLHAEMNPSTTTATTLFQLWMYSSVIK